jgi:hypothetical protein
MNMICLTITQLKNELQKLQKLRSMSQGVLPLALLVCSLVFLPSSYSNAGGVNSNTIIDGTSTTSTSSGSPTSTTVTNEDGSTTTTDVTTITTTTTTKNVTQTEVPNVVTNPTFTNELGGGSLTGWSITQCPGGCAFSPTNGFMAGNGGTITQTYSQSDLFANEIDSTEASQGMSFNFGAEVDNNQADNNLADTWSIKLELFDSDNSSLGHTEIGSTVIFAPTIKTGTLDIDSGNVVNSGVLTLFGDTALNGDYRFGPFFNDVFTTFTYNEIGETITSALTYETLITQVSCEVLDTCAVIDISTANDIATGTIDVVSDTSVTETVIAAPVMIAPLPTVVASVENTLEVAEIETISEIGNDTTNSSNTGSSVESETVSESLEVEPEAEQESKPQVTQEKQSAKPKVSNVEPKKSGNSNSVAKLRAEPKGKKTTPKQKAAVKKKAMSKAGNKAVKKMGDKKYSNTNQIKTLVIMQVLGNTRSFFDAQAQLKDTPNFFSNTTIPDSSISDNNYTSYFLFGGSDSDHNALVESQYRR